MTEPARLPDNPVLLVIAVAWELLKVLAWAALAVLAFAAVVTTGAPIIHVRTTGGRGGRR